MNDTRTDRNAPGWPRCKPTGTKRTLNREAAAETKKPASAGYRLALGSLGLLLGRGEWIRTSDTCVPNAVLYQAELHPDGSRHNNGGPPRRTPILAKIPCKSKRQTASAAIAGGFRLGMGRARVVERAGRPHRLQHAGEFGAAAVVDRVAHAPLLRRAMLHGVDQRQGGLAFGEVVADVLAGLE